jgi:hypothetical protein
VKPAAKVAAVERERLVALRRGGVAEDPPDPGPERGNIGRHAERNGGALDDQRVRQAGAQVAQVPAEAVAWIDGLVEQELG